MRIGVVQPLLPPRVRVTFGSKNRRHRRGSEVLHDDRAVGTGEAGVVRALRGVRTEDPRAAARDPVGAVGEWSCDRRVIVVRVHDDADRLRRRDGHGIGTAVDEARLTVRLDELRLPWSDGQRDRRSWLPRAPDEGRGRRSHERPEVLDDEGGVKAVKPANDVREEDGGGAGREPVVGERFSAIAYAGLLVHDRDDLRAEAPHDHRKLRVVRQVGIVVRYLGEGSSRSEARHLLAGDDAPVDEAIENDLEIGARTPGVLHYERRLETRRAAERLGDIWEVGGARRCGWVP